MEHSSEQKRNAAAELQAGRRNHLAVVGVHAGKEGQHHVFNLVSIADEIFIIAVKPGERHVETGAHGGVGLPDGCCSAG